MLRSSFRLLIIFSVLFISAEAWGREFPIPQKAFGVWDKRGSYLFQSVPSHVKGMGIHMNWGDVQNKPNDPNYYQFDYFRDAIAWAAENEVSVYLKLYPVTGNINNDRDAAYPLFFDMKDADIYVRSFQMHGHWYPDYKSANYKKHYTNMVLAFGDFVYSLPEDKRKWVSHIYVQTGAHGDPGPYNKFNDVEGLPKAYQYTWETWQHWRTNDFSPAWKAAFQENGRNTSLAFNSCNPTSNKSIPIYEWINENIKNYGMKPSNRNARGSHLHNEMKSVSWYRPRSIDPGGHDGSYAVEFEIRYFDKGNGQFTFYYDSLSGKNKQGETVKVGHSAGFVVKRITIPDGKFNGRCEKNSDFYIVCDNNDVILTSIEVLRR